MPGQEVPPSLDFELGLGVHPNHVLVLEQDLRPSLDLRPPQRLEADLPLVVRLEALRRVLQRALPELALDRFGKQD